MSRRLPYAARSSSTSSTRHCMCHRTSASNTACDAFAVSYDGDRCNIPHGPSALLWPLVFVCAARPFGAAVTSLHFVRVRRRVARSHPQDGCMASMAIRSKTVLVLKRSQPLHRPCAVVEVVHWCTNTLVLVALLTCSASDCWLNRWGCKRERRDKRHRCFHCALLRRRVGDLAAVLVLWAEDVCTSAVWNAPWAKGWVGNWEFGPGKARCWQWTRTCQAGADVVYALLAHSSSACCCIKAMCLVAPTCLCRHRSGVLLRWHQ